MRTINGVAIPGQALTRAYLRRKAQEHAEIIAINQAKERRLQQWQTNDRPPKSTPATS